MPFPDNYTVFPDVPPDFPMAYSDLTDPYLIWSYENRTLTEGIQAEITLTPENINTMVEQINSSVVSRIDQHDNEIKQRLDSLDSTLRQIVRAVVEEINENQYLIESKLGTIKVII